MANAISASRLLAALPFGWLMLSLEPRAALVAALLFGFAIATDLADGVVARRWGTQSAAGRSLDHTADFAFVTAGLAAAAARGAVPWLLPLVIALAFLQYVLDSTLKRWSGELRMSRLGRLNGILYFVPLGGDVLARLGLEFLAVPTRVLAWGLVGSTLLSIADRLGWSLGDRRRARGSLDAEKQDR